MFTSPSGSGRNNFISSGAISCLACRQHSDANGSRQTRSATSCHRRRNAANTGAHPLAVFGPRLQRRYNQCEL